MKNRLFLPLILIFWAILSFEALAQTTGDYRTRIAAVTWTTDGSWERFNGTTWVTVTTEGYPGESAVAGTVTIQTRWRYN